MAIVNGAPWPVLQVELRRYLFRLLDGSNARVYRLSFGDAVTGEPTPPVYIIGSDDNYLDASVNVTGKTIVTTGESWPDGTTLPAELIIAPGERIYVVVDFTGLANGTKVTLINNAAIPFPGGLVPGVDVTQLNMNKIMQFQVSLPLKGKKDKSCDPAAGRCNRPSRMVRLTDGNGNLAPGVEINKVRQLVLKEHEGPGGPIEVLVNNTHWDGLMSQNIDSAVFPDGVTELPEVGSTELWEIINLTMDAHPMHTHLTQFQILNREAFDPTYLDAWGAAFGSPLPAACTDGTNTQNPCPGYGPPLPYQILNDDGALGGNPAIGPYLIGIKAAPDQWESGWKDTAKALPGEVLRMVIRWTPTSIPNLLAKPRRNLYTFDPTTGPGYVWHCHIIDHEDNEMMRPYKVVKHPQ